MASISDELYCVHLLLKLKSKIGKILTAKVNGFIHCRLVPKPYILTHNNKLRIDADIMKHINIWLLSIKTVLSLAVFNEKNIKVNTPFQEIVQSPFIMTI